MLSRLGDEKIGEYIDKQGLNNITTGRLAYIVLGVKALCQDPKSYHGYNLIKTVEDGIKKYPVVGFNHPFPYALAVLSVCTSGYGQDSYETYTKMLSKMIMKNRNSVHAGDTISMATMALTCMYKSLRRLRRLDCRYVYWYRRTADRKLCRLRSKLRWIIWFATRWLRRRQKRDGSFGNSITSAHAVQVHYYSFGLRLVLLPSVCARSFHGIIRWLCARSLGLQPAKTKKPLASRPYPYLNISLFVFDSCLIFGMKICLPFTVLVLSIL